MSSTVLSGPLRSARSSTRGRRMSLNVTTIPCGGHKHPHSATVQMGTQKNFPKITGNDKGSLGCQALKGGKFLKRKGKKRKEEELGKNKGNAIEWQSDSWKKKV